MNRFYKILKICVVLLIIVSVLIIIYDTRYGANREDKLNKAIAEKDSIIAVNKKDMLLRDSLIKQYKDSMIFYVSMVDAYDKEQGKQNKEDYEKGIDGIVNGTIDDNINLWTEETID